MKKNKNSVKFSLLIKKIIILWLLNSQKCLNLRNCYYITKINFTKIEGNKLVSKLFYNCDGLHEINLEELDIKNEKKTNEIFLGCNSLTNLDLSILFSSNNKDITSIFYGMKILVYINLVNFSTKNVKCMKSMFEDCLSLETIKFGVHFKTLNVLDMSRMFKGCVALKNLKLPTFKTDNLITWKHLIWCLPILQI